MSTSQREGLWNAGFGELGATLRALEKQGITLEDLKCIRSCNHLLFSVVAQLHVIRAFNEIKHEREQIEAWREANTRGGFGISDEEFDHIPESTYFDYNHELQNGYVGYCLFYGFGGDGEHSDMMLSGKVAWEYLASRIPARKWHRLDFDDPKKFRPRDGAHSRPKGFYWKKVHLGHYYIAQDRDEFHNLKPVSDWGMGPEGLQFLAVTHPHYVDCLRNKEFPFLMLGDYVFNTDLDFAGPEYRIPYLGFWEQTEELKFSGLPMPAGREFGICTLAD